MRLIRPSRVAGSAAIALCAACWMPAAGAQTSAPAGTEAGTKAGTKAGTEASKTAQVRRPSNRAIGSDTRSLLAIQREGSQAGATLHTPGEQAALAHTRYLKSFEHPIPERFVGQSSGSGGIGLVGLTPSR